MILQLQIHLQHMHLQHMKQTISNKENDDSSLDEDNENEESPNAPNVNTLLTGNTIDPNKTILCSAPGEHQKPIFTNEDTEYLCFPTIFCGQRRNNNKYYKLSKREIFKYEMRSIDKRVSTNIPNIFWKTKYKQINQIHQKYLLDYVETKVKAKQLLQRYYLT